MLETDIDYNLFSYVDRIEKQLEIGKLVTTETEDFFLRIFSATYNLKNLQNLNYIKTNIKAIDLIERDEKLGIQITAQKSSEIKKIGDTIKGTINYWKNQGICKLWIFFISETEEIKKIDTTSEYCSIDGISVWIKTVKKLIGDINANPKEERFRIDELIKQETSKEYYGLSKLTVFKQIEKGQRIVNDNFFNLVDTIYFSKKEFETIKHLSERFNDGKIKEYCILGNPCSGKTTFAYSVIQNISKKKVFYLNLSNPSLDGSRIVEELIQISHNHSLVVIDNIHDSVELFKQIRERILTHKWINALYLSRYYKTFDELNVANIYRIIENIPYFRIDTNENFEEKVAGIIETRIRLLKRKGGSVNWYKGDFIQILKNTNRNLLKLNIGLRMWEQKNSPTNQLAFDKIDSNKILQQFYEEHKLHYLKNDALYTYCLLFKNDIPFIPLRVAYEQNKELREKGIVLQYFKSDFCFFPHKEYAQLIYDSFVYMDNGIQNEKKVSLILNYLNTFDINENKLDLIYILSRLFYSGDRDIVPFLLNEDNISKLVKTDLNNTDIKFYHVNTILNIIFQLSENIKKGLLVNYFDIFISFFKNKKLNLFIYEHYMAYTRLLQISNEVSKVLLSNEISFVLRKNEIADTNSIIELTLRISRKSRTSETVSRILNSFAFPEWLNMINSLPKLSNITNSLSELNTSSEAKKLLDGLMNNLNWDSLYESSKSLKIDQFAKSLRELQKIDTSVGTSVSQYLFNKASSESYILGKLKSANLSEYSKALSDISNINPDFVKAQLLTDLKNNSLKEKFANEPGISNFTARALELKKHFDNAKPFIELIYQVASSDLFINKIEIENNLNHLLLFNEFRTDYLKNTGSKLNTVINRAINKLIKDLPDKLDVISNPKFLNVVNIDSDFIDSVTSIEIENYFKTNKITYAEDLFRVLSSINKDKTIELFKEVKNDIIVNPLLNHELNFSQSLEALNKLKNKVYKDETNNCNLKVNAIMNDYLRRYQKIENRYNNVNITDFFKGYYFGYCIDSSTIEKYCKYDFLKKLKSDKHKGFEIASLFQYTRRISVLTNNNYDNELGEFLELNTANFIDAIKNEEITKTLSGLCELGLCIFANYADDLLYKSKKSIIQKVKQRQREEIYKVKLLPDLEKIAKVKGKIVIKEIKK